MTIFLSNSKSCDEGQISQSPKYHLQIATPIVPDSKLLNLLTKVAVSHIKEAGTCKCYHFDR